MVKNGPKRRLTGKMIALVVAGVALVVGIALAVAIVLMPSKQEYKEVADAQTNLRTNYQEYLKQGTPRGMLVLSAYTSSFMDAVGGGSINTQTEPQLMVDQSRLEAIEAKEREIAQRITKSEQYLDELVSNLNDRDVKRQYDAYKKERQAIYGEDGSFTDLTESVISVHRYLYSCQSLVETDWLWSIEEAQAVLSYAKGCVAAGQELTDGGTLIDRHQEVVNDIGELIQERIELLSLMIESGEIDSEVYERLHQSQEDDLTNVAADSQRLIPIGEILKSLNDNLGGLLTEKQNRAFGSIEER